MNEKDYVLQMKDISKSFPGVKALNKVSLSVKKGTVHTLMGENGAGKSTLMKILIGMYFPDEGTIFYKGSEVKIDSTHQALNMGISMIHQELSPIPDMTVSENIFLGREFLKKTGLVDVKKGIEETHKLFERLNISGISAKAKMKTLSVAQLQMVEIAKAISYNSDLIIMDEPTSAISNAEVETLFKIIRELTTAGTCIIYISHKMDEIFQISDEITVFRDGEYVGTELAEKLNKEMLIKWMVGRELNDLFVKEKVEPGQEILRVEGFSNKDLFQDVNFSLKKGEILGIAGLVGSGRTEIVETLFGMRGKYSGKVFIKGNEVKISNPKDAIANGIALATEDRKTLGLCLGLSIKHNISISVLDDMSWLGLVSSKSEDEKCEEMVEMLKIKTNDADRLVKTLSGGNQQKVVLAKWLLTDPDVLILDEPTRGIDIGAKAEIYKIMESLVKQGKAIIMVSSEMPEILGMSDRVIVMADGVMKGEVSREEASQEVIMNVISDL